jgi:putative transposase
LKYRVGVEKLGSKTRFPSREFLPIRVFLLLVIAYALRARWLREYGTMVRRLERDLPELLSFFVFPRHLWRKLRTTNVIERCFVEVRRRTRPMVCFVNVESVDRIIYSIFQRFNLEWKTRTLNLFTQAA